MPINYNVVPSISTPNQESERTGDRADKRIIFSKMSTDTQAKELKSEIKVASEPQTIHKQGSNRSDLLSSEVQTPLTNFLNPTSQHTMTEQNFFQPAPFTEYELLREILERMVRRHRDTLVFNDMEL